ncbi:ABC transporter permease [Sphingobacterium suaedae]|uniref:ABC transporter permease n=1 Tax=Sphingobacterium suaedae TaxID=1686402 RepID=A0ABW5KH52_9SPHI
MNSIIFKNSIRHLFRNKLYTILNVLGLSIGISACWVIYKFVSYELSFENGIENKEHTYRLISKFGEDGEFNFSGGISSPIYFYMKEELAGIERVVPVFRRYTKSVRVPLDERDEGKKEYFDLTDQEIIKTEPNYFDMVPYEWLAGDKNTALDNPFKVVLTDTRAKHYFPNTSYENMLGRTLVYDDTIQVAVTGVIKTLDFPTEFKGQEFLQLDKSKYDLSLGNWTNTNNSDMVYFQTDDAQAANLSLANVQQKVNDNWKKFKQENKINFTYNRQIEKLPLLESHFATDVKDSGIDKTSKKVIYGLIGTAIFLLVLACINYVNLTTAQLPQRNKEIGIRKTLGSKAAHLILQMMLETMLVITMAIVLSGAISHFAISALEDFFSRESIQFHNPVSFALFLGTVLIFTVLLAGLYPSWIITKVNAVNIFRNKGQLHVTTERINLRKVLIVFQFVVAQVFIVSALIIGKQMSFTIHKDLGFNKDAVITTEIPYKLRNSENYSTKRKTLIEELRTIPGIKNVSLGEKPMEDQVSSSVFNHITPGVNEPEMQRIFLKSVDTAYLELYDLELVAGQNLLPSDTVSSFVINESAVTMFGFKSPEDAIGKIIGQGKRRFPIMGVIKDFHITSFYTVIEPMALRSYTANVNTINIKFEANKSGQIPELIDLVNKKWNQFFPQEEFNYTFYDDSIAELYIKEQQLLKLTNISTAIAILISCLGLFGLATIIAYQRSKEIGIRKVLGASISGIVSLLSKDFVKMVLIAILIASPIVWWGCNKWLEDFVYKIEISWIPFGFGGLIAVTAALLTVSYQALKAAKVNPVESLRDE